MTIFVMVAVSLLTMIEQGIQSQRIAWHAEAQLVRANDALAAVAIWTRTELDLSLGTTRLREWQLTISKPYDNVYVVALSDTATRKVVLQTALYRPEDTRESTP